MALQCHLGSNLPDNFLPIEAAKYERAMAEHVGEWEVIRRKCRSNPKKLWQAAQTMRHKLPLRSPLLAAWRTLQTRFERAVLDGDPDWFTRQAKALRSVQSQEKIQFNAEVVHLLELRMWGTNAIPLALGVEEPDLTLTPAAKFTDATASDIYKALRKEEKKGVLYVEGCPFESKEDAMDGIRKLAKKLQFAMKKQTRK